MAIDKSTTDLRAVPFRCGKIVLIVFAGCVFAVGALGWIASNFPTILNRALTTVDTGAAFVANALTSGGESFWSPAALSACCLAGVSWFVGMLLAAARSTPEDPNAAVEHFQVQCIIGALLSLAAFYVCFGAFTTVSGNSSLDSEYQRIVVAVLYIAAWLPAILLLCVAALGILIALSPPQSTPK